MKIETEKKLPRKPNRKGVFVGGYLPPICKKFLTIEAKKRNITVSQLLAKIILKQIKKKPFDENI